MGNNNVIGQQASEEPTHGVDKNIEPSNGSPGIDNTEDNEKEGTQDEQVTSNQSHLSSKIEDADEKNRGSIQDNASIQDGQSDTLSNKDHELVEDVETETTINPTEIVTPVSNAIEDMISVNDSLVSSEKIKQLEHGNQDKVRQSTMVNPSSLFAENLEGSPEEGEEPRSRENTWMGGNLASEDSNEILEKGHIVLSTIEDQLMKYHKRRKKSVQSTKTITEPMLVSDEVTEVANPEYSACEVKNGLEKHELNERVVSSRMLSDSVTATVEHSDVERTYMKEGIVVTTVAVHNLAEIFEREKESKEYDDQLVSPLVGNRNLALSSSYHIVTVNEGKDKRLNGIVECDKGTVKEIQEQGTADIYAERLGQHSPFESNGNWTVSSSCHLVTVNEGKEQKVNGILGCHKDTVKEIQEQSTAEIYVEGLGQHINAQVTPKEGGDLRNLQMIMPSDPVLLLEDFENSGCIKPDISDSKEGTITSTYCTRIIVTQDIIDSSQGGQSGQLLLEEHKVVKLENGEIISTCIKSVEEQKLNIDNILTDASNHEKAGVSSTHIGFTIESNQEEDTRTATAVGFTAEGNQAKVTAGVDKATEKQYPLQMSTSKRESSEETPLVQRGEITSSHSNSTKQHTKVSMGKPTTNISAMQCKSEAEEESEKSPLLSPREPSGDDFRVPSHSARKIKPFQNLLTESRTGMLSSLKEHQSIPNNKNELVSSPRSKRKQKTRASLFTNCICCVTPAN
ncbi:hypothetical protein PR202_gb29748 [Eleusine coracana subsp. coracana]|uniref:Uncharacterized protein n=1 Tax=Eleusine coracana subsp. coracana TaxID=191504 RepID=A0AAV5FXY6_ELECO|nr:hypothetical protein PR202_gb29748 [Eleusine coracana subsp. coracana]